jgi:hypothetical protein
MEPISAEQAARTPSNKPTTTASHKLNPQTGVISNSQAKFSADKWGAAMRSYVRSIDKMNEGSLREIVKLATRHMSPVKGHRQGTTSPSPESLLGVSEMQDFRACLRDEWYVSSFLNPLMALSFLDTVLAFVSIVITASLQVSICFYK